MKRWCRVVISLFFLISVLLDIPLCAMQSRASARRSTFSVVPHQRRDSGNAAQATAATEGVNKKIFIYRGKTWQGYKHFADNGYITQYLKRKIKEGRKKEKITIGKQDIANRTDMFVDIAVIDSALTNQDFADSGATDRLNEEMDSLHQLVEQAVDQGFTEIHFFTSDIGFGSLSLLSQALVAQLKGKDEDDICAMRKSRNTRVTFGYTEKEGGSYYPLIQQDTPTLKHEKRRVSVVTHTTDEKFKQKEMHKSMPADHCFKWQCPILQNSVRSDDDASPYHNVLRRQSVTARNRRGGRAMFKDWGDVTITLHFFGDMPQGSAGFYSPNLDTFVMKHYPKKLEDYSFPPQDDVSMGNEPYASEEKVKPGGCSCCENCTDEDIEFAKDCAKVALKVVIGVILMVI